MNRSYSKIRHVQEANLILEQRRILLKEETTTVTTTIAPSPTTQTTTINQMVDGPRQFYFDENNVRNYYIYQQGAKFYVYYQDNPSNNKQPDKLARLDNLSYDTKDKAIKSVMEDINRNKVEKQGGYED